MKKEEFIKLAPGCGYGSEDRARDYTERNPKSNHGNYREIQGVVMFEELYKFISRLHCGIKFMPEKNFNELLSRCDWEQKIYALCFRYW